MVNVLNTEENYKEVEPNIHTKVLFKVNNSVDDARILGEFLYDNNKLKSITNWDVALIAQFHSPLYRELENNDDISKKDEILLRYVTRLYRDQAENLQETVKKFQNEWSPNNDSYLKAIGDLFEISPNILDKNIYGYISINPICPRWLDEQYFTIFSQSSLNGLKEVTAHEVQHFLFFKKWEEVFFKGKTDQEIQKEKQLFNYPHLPWALSEILTPAFLSDPSISSIVGTSEPQKYEQFDKASIGGKSVNEYFKQLFQDSREEGEPFYQFLKKALKEGEKYKGLILSSF